MKTTAGKSINVVFAKAQVESRLRRPNPPGKTTGHKNQDKSDDRSSNLRPETGHEQMQSQWDQCGGDRKKPRGGLIREIMFREKLAACTKQQGLVDADFGPWDPTPTTAAAFVTTHPDILRTKISKVLTGKRTHTGGYSFKYMEAGRVPGEVWYPLRIYRDQQRI